MSEHETPETNDPDATASDPRNHGISGHEGMPAEFIDTPDNQPGDHSPPNPASGADDSDDDDCADD